MAICTAGEEGPPQKPRGGLRGDRGRPPAAAAAAAACPHQAYATGNIMTQANGDAGEEVDLVQNVRVHASLLGLVGLGGHVLLAKHVSELEGELLPEQDKAAPSEGGLSDEARSPRTQLARGRHADPRNGAQDDRREDGGEGLQRLDGVREGHGDRA